jgi:1,4-dihydroxy-2-naphthoate octaprenyltransferase
MSLKETALIVIFLMLIQMVIIIFITRSNKDFFDSEKAIRYVNAIAELAKVKPRSALIIMLCYAACLVELFVLLLFKYSK